MCIDTRKGNKPLDRYCWHISCCRKALGHPRWASSSPTAQRNANYHVTPNRMCCPTHFLLTISRIENDSSPPSAPFFLPISLLSSWIPSFANFSLPPGSLSLSPVRTTMTKEIRKAKTIFDTRAIQSTKSCQKPPWQRWAACARSDGEWF